MKIKKYVAIITSAITICSALPFNYNNLKLLSMNTLSSNAQPNIYNDLEYVIKQDNTVEISSHCNSISGDIEIPSQIKGRTVTSIADRAFMWCHKITSVKIPDTVSHIGKTAFHGCDCLKSITLPSNLTSIEEETFWDCPMLESISLPDSVTSIGTAAFRECSSLASISIPDGVTNINSMTFYFCTKLQNIVLPKNLKTIDSYAFSNCTSLKSVDIPDGTEEIGFYCFSVDSSLETVYIPDSLKKVGILAFCETLWYEKQSNGPLYLGKAFYEYKGDAPENTNPILNDGTFSITKYSLIYCNGISSLTLPNSVCCVGDSALELRKSIKSVTILNPDCEIFDSDSTISNDHDAEFKYSFSGTIYGYKDSTAQAYAQKYNYKFIALDSTSEQSIISGDANCDNTVDISDIVTIRRYIIDSEKYGLSQTSKNNSDFDGNNSINAQDIVAILKFLLGNDSSEI